jgi:hypothetical protein
MGELRPQLLEYCLLLRVQFSSLLDQLDQLILIDGVDQVLLLQVQSRLCCEWELFRVQVLRLSQHLLIVEVMNLMDERIDLDPAQDRFVARVGRDRLVTGVSSLVAADGATWDKIAEQRRKSLAYPKTLDRRARIKIYVFFPADELIDLPLGFEWSVGEGNRSFDLRRPLAKKK